MKSTSPPTTTTTEKTGNSPEPLLPPSAALDMSGSWQQRLQSRLGDAAAVGNLRALPESSNSMTRRALAPADCPVDLSSNDYLALRRHPHLIESVRRAAEQHGVGAGASRLLAPECLLHKRIEQRFAAFKRAEAALILPSGWTANAAVLTTLAQRGDLILADKLSHASIIDGARLATASETEVAFRTFAHSDISRARTLALRHLDSNPSATVLLVTDSVFSMDGDVAPLADLAALRDDLNARARLTGSGGCVLILDEAHATGVLGQAGAGLDEICGHVADIVVSTASKALGSLGGIVTGPQIVIDAITNFARPFMYTTGVPPTQAAAIGAAMDVIEREPQRRQRLHEVIGTVRDGLRKQGWPVAPAKSHPTPIIPLITGTSDSALRLSAKLREAGIVAPAIRPPTVARGAARVRLSLNAALTDDQLLRLLITVGEPSPQPADLLS